MVIALINFFSQWSILDIIDILLVALLFYEVYQLIKGTAAINIFLGILAIFLLSKIVRVLQFQLLASILDQFISVGFIALIVVFQPEIRRFLLLLGTPAIFQKWKNIFFKNSSNQTKLPINTIVQASKKMADTKTGALIVIVKQNELESFILTGEIINATVSAQLLETIFAKNTPLHDGAVIVQENIIKAARCILPVSGNREMPESLGLRHRSAIGITEQSDAITIIISEQTGNISYCQSGNLTNNVTPDQLRIFLESEFNNININSLI